MSNILIVAGVTSLVLVGYLVADQILVKVKGRGLPLVAELRAALAKL